MLKVTGRVMPGAPSLLPITVFAAAGDGKEEPTGRVSLNELSLYTAPRQQESRYVVPEAGQLEQSVATVRSLAEPYASWFRVTYDKIKPKVQSVVQSGTDTYDYLQNPPKDFYPRAGVIGFTGVLGLVLARGSRIKKLIYPTVLLAVSASLYYPEQAAAAAKSGGESVYECAVQGCAALEKMLKPQSKSDKADPKP